MHFPPVLYLSFVASALAYQVTSPSATKGWTNSGSQILTWQRVDTDPLNFTAVLTNEDKSIFPEGKQVLAALVDGALLQINLNPPGNGWTIGGSYRIDLVKDTDNLDTILAQSNEFEINDPTTMSLTSTGTGTATRTTAKPMPATLTAATTGTTNTGSASSPSDGSNPPGTTNAASQTLGGYSVLLSIFAMLGFVLA